MIGEDWLLSDSIGHEEKVNLIVSIEGKLNECLRSPRLCQKYGLDSGDIIFLLTYSKQIEKYLKPEICQVFNITSYDIVLLMKESNNVDHFLMADNFNDFGIDAESVIELILQSKNIDTYLTPEYVQKFGFEGKETRTLIAATGKIDQYLNSPDKLQELKITQDDIEFLKKIKNLFQNTDRETWLQEVSKKGIKYNNIGLDPRITFGIEIESEQTGAYQSILFREKSCLLEEWDKKSDITLSLGVEVASPPLNDNKESIENIYIICGMIECIGQEVTDNCGGHIHIGADYLKSISAYKNLLDIWTSCEKIIYLMSNKEGEIPRNNILRYASMMSSKIDRAISVELLKADDLSTFIKRIKYIQKDDNGHSSRFFGINFLNVSRFRNNTIEFRTSNGTLDPDVWIENIRLFGRMVEISEKLAEIEEKTEWNDEEIAILQMKEKLKDNNLSEHERMEILVHLLFKEDERDVYIRRYNANYMIYESAGLTYLENSYVEAIIKNSELAEAKSMLQGDRLKTNKSGASEQEHQIL